MKIGRYAKNGAMEYRCKETGKSFKVEKVVYRTYCIHLDTHAERIDKNELNEQYVFIGEWLEVQSA